MAMLAKLDAKKRKLLASLSQPPTDYKDASPKGSVDEGVRDLIVQINDTPGFVTTSSCAGRIAVYLDGPPKLASNAPPVSKGDEANAAITASGSGKGGGGWLFSSHSPVDLSSHSNKGAIFHHFGMSPKEEASVPSAEATVRYVHFKFEPMILHILAASIEEAQAALHAAVQSGFRESGISGLLDGKGRPSTPMVAVRSSGLALDSIIGFVDTNSSGTETANVQPMVSEPYLRAIVKVANDRFQTNEERKLRFAAAWIQHHSTDTTLLAKQVTSHSESSAARRERKRTEGLERRHRMLLDGDTLDGTSEKRASQTIEGKDDYGLDILTSEESGKKPECI